MKSIDRLFIPNDLFWDERPVCYIKDRTAKKVFNFTRLQMSILLICLFIIFVNIIGPVCSTEM